MFNTGPATVTGGENQFEMEVHLVSGRAPNKFRLERMVKNHVRKIGVNGLYG
jgi:hypothetical protein